jgi:hypothetical protein
MSAFDDDLRPDLAAERVFYAAGALLTEADFRTEQRYHRGRLGRVLAYLHGAGTVAGLDVRVEPESGADAEIRVSPGIAIDRLGRLIELPYEACLGIARWYEQQQATELERDRLDVAFRAGSGGAPDHVVVDVFARFIACAREPQPAFADAGAENLNGIQPSRILDAVQLSLVLRHRDDDLAAISPRPEGPAAADADGIRRFKREQLWQTLQLEQQDPPRLPLGPEHVPLLHDGSEVLLGRVRIPSLRDPGELPRFDPNQPARFDEDVRLYAYAARELALLHGLDR